MNTTDFARTHLDKLGDTTAMYAVVGVGDFAVEKLREARANFDADSWRDQAQAKLVAGVESVQAELRATEQLTDLPVRMQAAVADAISATVMAYAALATRGRTVLDHLRTQPSAAEADQQVEVTILEDETTMTMDEDSDGTTDSAPPPVV
jgi:hypothetical protein